MTAALPPSATAVLPVNAVLKPEGPVQHVDIGELVDSLSRLETQLAPLQRNANRIRDILQWRQPLNSALAMAGLLTLCALPVVLLLTLASGLAMFLAYLYLMRDTVSSTYFDASWVKAIKAYEQRISKPSNEDLLRVKLARFNQLLQGLQKAIDWLSANLDHLYSVFLWSDWFCTAKASMVVALVIALIAIVPTRLLLAYATVVAFAGNSGFGQVLRMPFTLPTPSPKKPASNDEPTVVEKVEPSAAPDDWVMVNRGDSQGNKTGDAGTASQASSNNGNSGEAGLSNGGRGSLQSDGTGTMKRRTSRAERIALANSTSHCSNCKAEFGIFRKRQYCRNCGENYCGSCCRFKIPRKFFGATAPAAERETVRVCEPCMRLLRQRDDDLDEASASSQ